VPLDVTHIDLMPGLEIWYNLVSTTLRQKLQFSDYNSTMGVDMRDMMTLLEITSRTLWRDTDGCMGSTRACAV
jgi:hypothetical protein